MFQQRTGSIDLDPAEVCALLRRGDIALVDVREPAEHQREHIEGAVCMPLSRFDPNALGADPGRVVFHCLSGKRSAAAVSHCQRRGLAAVRHMRGGIAAWKAAGLPTRC
jgi:rhodanese-related sulfurtransferase